MTFQKIIDAAGCNCLDRSEENTRDIFLRVLKDRPKFSIRDFRSYYEEGKRPNVNNCVNMCAHCGVSLYKSSDENLALIKEHFSHTFRISPKLKGNIRYYVKLRFKENCGKVRRTGNSFPEHYNFYKCDEFKIKDIEILDKDSFNVQN